MQMLPNTIPPRKKKQLFPSKYCAVLAKIPNQVIMSCWEISNYIFAARAASHGGKGQDFPKQKM